MEKNKREQSLTPRMLNIIRCCISKCKSRCRCCTFERRSCCNETFVMHECLKWRRKSRVQCVNLNYFGNWILHGHSIQDVADVVPSNAGHVAMKPLWCMNVLNGGGNHVYNVWILIMWVTEFYIATVSKTWQMLYLWRQVTLQWNLCDAWMS